LLLDVTTTCWLMLYLKKIAMGIAVTALCAVGNVDATSATIAACCPIWLIVEFQILSMLSLHALLLAVPINNSLHHDSCW